MMDNTRRGYLTFGEVVNSAKSTNKKRGETDGLTKQGNDQTWIHRTTLTYPGDNLNLNLDTYRTIFTNPCNNLNKSWWEI